MKRSHGVWIWLIKKQEVKVCHRWYKAGVVSGSQPTKVKNLSYGVISCNLQYLTLCFFLCSLFWVLVPLVTQPRVSEDLTQAVGSGRLSGELHANRARASPQVAVKVGLGTHQPLMKWLVKDVDMLGYYFRFEDVCIQSHGRLLCKLKKCPMY